MRSLITCFLLLISTISARAQEPAAPQAVTVYKAGPNVTDPDLLPTDFSTAIATGCRVKPSGTVKLATVVDAQGIPRNIMFVKPTGTDLDRLALSIVSMDRFTPAKQGANPIAAGELIEIKLNGCVVREADPAGKVIEHLRPAAAPIQTLSAYKGFPNKVIFATESPTANQQAPDPQAVYSVGGEISSPVLLNHPDPGLTVEDRNELRFGPVRISLIVDVHGMPVRPHLIQSAGKDIDKKALEETLQFRYKPALKAGMQPVPVSITINIMSPDEMYQPRAPAPGAQ